MLGPLVRRIHPPGLVARFTLVGLAVGLLVASGLAWFIEVRLSDLLLTEVVARAIDQVKLGILDEVDPADFEPPYTVAKLDNLAQRLDPLLVSVRTDNSGVIRLHVFAHDGTVVYSDLPSKRGQTVDFASLPLLAEAFAGSTGKQVSSLSSVENSDLKARYDSALEVYVPLVVNGQVVGAYEIYQDLAPVHPLRPLVWGAVLGGTTVLFCALFVVMRGAAAHIRIQQAALAYQAYHDPLTQLPNRALFMDRLERALARAHRHSSAVAVLFLDLDNFKMVNDTLGHHVGDQLLVAVADRLHGSLRATDTAARLGGDECAVLLEDVEGIQDPIHTCERILERFKAPFAIDGHELFISASIGVALSAPGHDQPNVMLREADIAMYRAKATGKARYELFDRTLETRVRERLTLETDLRRAVERGELGLHYQPIVQLGTGQVSEVEALLRWHHPRRGMVSPGEFIPLAEETGLIVPIGLLALEQACRQAHAWHQTFPRASSLVMNVNLSARQFHHPRLVEDVARVLNSSGVDPRTIKLELTESVMMHDNVPAIRTLRELKALGLGVALDDFGTGYSSLSVLRQCPIDLLKIDRMFVQQLGRNHQDTAIVRAVITLAKTLDLRVTSEGIETAEQAAMLQHLGCEQGQGYFFARPLPPEDLSAILASGYIWQHAAPCADARLVS